MPRWSDMVQRGILLATLEGRLRVSADSVLPSWFTGDARKEIASQALAFRARYRRFPKRATLREILLLLPEPFPLMKELSTLYRLREEDVQWALDQATAELKAEALFRTGQILLEAAEGEGTETDVRHLVDQALRTASVSPEETPYRDYAWERHQEEIETKDPVISPLGLPTLDGLKGGGLKPGELGLILGGTSKGKSHIAVHIGAEAVLRGHPVLHVSMELALKDTAKRYDRRLSLMDTQEIYLDRQEFESRLEKALPDPKRLRILHFPGYELSPTSLGDILKEALDGWGSPCILVVDYGSLLRSDTKGTKYVEVGDVHAALAAMARREKVPIWSPYQANRMSEIPLDGDGEIKAKLYHAGDSWAPMQHADLVIGLGQSPDDLIHRRLALSFEKSRSSPVGSVSVTYNWSKSHIQEIRLAQTKTKDI